MNVLVTGGAGFIGSHVVDKLIERGDSVVVLDDFNDYYDPKYKRRNLSHHIGNSDVQVVEGDICDKKFVEHLFDTYQIDSIIHLAARAGVRPSIEDPILYQRVNIGGTYTILDSAKKKGIKNIVIASSSSVYGNNTKTPFSENDSVDKPVSPYAATKKAVEEIAYTYHYLYDLNIICLRFFTVYGERGRPDMAPWLFTKKIIREEPIKQFGDGSSCRDYTYIGDIVRGVISAIDRVDHIKYDIINLGNGNPVVLKDFIRTIENISEKKAIIDYLPEQPGDVKMTHADIAKAKELLDYSPSVGVEEGLEKFINWYKKRFAI